MPAHAHAQHLRKSIDPNVSTNMSPTKAENTDTKHRYRNTGRKHRHRNHINIAYKPIQSLCQKAPSTIGFATLSAHSHAPPPSPLPSRHKLDTNCLSQTGHKLFFEGRMASRRFFITTTTTATTTTITTTTINH